MSVTLQKGAPARAESLASQIEVLSIQNELGTAAVVVAPARCAFTPYEIKPHAIVVMADKNGLFLASNFTRELDAPFALTTAVVCTLSVTRQGAGSGNAGLRANPAIGVLDGEVSKMVADLIDKTVEARFGKDHTDTEKADSRDVRIALVDGLKQDWHNAVALVAAALSETERATVECLSRAVVFKWLAFNACAMEGEAGEKARAFMWRNPAIGCFVLAEPSFHALVQAGASDRKVIHDLCRSKYFVQGAALSTMRLARITQEEFVFDRIFLHDLARSDMPLDWLPTTGKGATDAGYAFTVAGSMGLVGYGRTLAPGLEPFAGCGGDWGRFRERIFAAVKVVDNDDLRSWQVLSNRSARARPMAQSFLRELVVPALIAHGHCEAIDGLERLLAVQHKSAAPGMFARWLLFRSSHVVACLARVNTYVKASVKIAKVCSTAPKVGAASFVMTDGIDDLFMPHDDGKQGVIALVRPGSRAEVDLIESGAYSRSYNGQWHARASALWTKSRYRMTLFRLPTSTLEGAVSAVVGIEKEDFHPTSAALMAHGVLDKVVGDHDGVLVGDWLLAKAGVVSEFQLPTVSLLSAYGGNESQWRDIEKAAVAPTTAYVDAAYSSWKSALPRRLRVDTAQEFAAVVAADLRAYLTLDTVSTLIAEAAPRLAARKRVLKRMAAGMNSVDASQLEKDAAAEADEMFAA